MENEKRKGGKGKNLTEASVFFFSFSSLGVMVTLALSEVRPLHHANIRPCLGCCASNGMLNFAKTFCFILQPDGPPKSKNDNPVGVTDTQCN